MLKIAVCTGGGDCPGLNAAIRALVLGAPSNWEVYGVADSYNGLETRPIRAARLDPLAVGDILDRGGTVLGTYNRGGLFTDPGGDSRAKRVIGGYKTLGLDCLVVIGGEGTQTMAQYLVDQGLNVVGIPKTIDNDLPETERTIGFESCVSLVAESLGKLRSTAESHDRVMILEVMGRDSGFIALHGGIAGGANVILIPEIPFAVEPVAETLRRRKQLGFKYSLVVVSEGAFPLGGEPLYRSSAGGRLNLGGIGGVVAQQLYAATTMETRVTVLGHLQRGGAPVASDKIFATLMAREALELIAAKKFGRVVVQKSGKISSVPYSKIAKFARRQVALDDPHLLTAETTGICLGRRNAS